MVHLTSLPPSQDLPRGKLGGQLPPAIVMTVTIAATTTRGNPLPGQEWQAVIRATELAERLEEARKKVSAFWPK